MLGAWAWLYYRYLSTVASWLHARVTLGVLVTLGDAKELRALFQLDQSLTWEPLVDVRRLPKEDRRTALLEALESIAPRRGRRLL